VSTPDGGIAPATPRVIRDVGEWDRLEVQWQDLCDFSPAASAVLQWDWLREWWRVYGPLYGSPDGLRIITVWREKRLIGALPLYEAARGRVPLGICRLQFISQGEDEFEETCPNYLNLLSLPGETDVCLQAVQRVLAVSGECRWDELVLSHIPDHSPLLAWQHGLAGVGQQQCSLVDLGLCQISSLGGGFDAYLAQLSSVTRKEVRRLLKAVGQAGVRLETAHDPSDVDLFFDQLVHLHQRRWRAEGRPGCFAAPRFTEFHRTLARRLVPRGRAVLARLMLRERPLAVFFGYLTGTKFDLYVSGVEPDKVEALRSPGTAAHLLLMAHLATAGITDYDHLLSSRTSYKERFATEARQLVRLQIVRANIRTGLRAATSLFRRGWRKGVAMFHRPVPARSQAAGTPTVAP
jgi:CelD/BcsL family acetyltransferase involved in cellulose biosynthesis